LFRFVFNRKFDLKR